MPRTVEGLPARSARAVRGWLTLTLACQMTTAAAYQIDYSADRPASLRPCDEMLWHGQRGAAQVCYGELLQSNPDTLVRAEIAWANDDVRGAHELFKAAVRERPGNAQILTRWGFLHLQTWQDQDAIQLFQEALTANADYQDARLGIATAVIGQYRESPDESIDKILEDNPRDIRTVLINARMELERSNLEAAQTQLALAREVLPGYAPPLEIDALTAAADYLLDVDPAAAINKVLAYNPVYGDLFVTLAHFSEITYRYRDASDFLQRGVDIEPDNWRARAALGMNEARLNHIDVAREHLAVAYRGDPFNPETVNMLRLFDTFPDYVVNTVTLQYEVAGIMHAADVIMRIHKDEDTILRPYVIDLFQRALPVFARRYDFIPEEPIVIEMYPNHDDFTVRTVGSPGVGLLGVTFGYLFAMDTPGGRTSGDFHWGTTLWHELAHVFTLEASAHRIPRWLSEGLSVYEEWHSGPVPSIQFRDIVFQALQEKLFLPVTELDGGFVRPTYADQVLVSYVQAGLICDYIDGRWGDAVFARIIAALRNGADTAAVVRQVLNIEPEEFDRQFLEHVHQKYAKVLENFDFWQELQGVMARAAQGRQWDDITGLARESLDIYPEHAESGSAWGYLARAAREAGDDATELDALEQFYARGGYVPALLRRLEEIYDARGEQAKAHQVRLSLTLVAPQEESLHRALASDFRGESAFDKAVIEYQMLLSMDVLDRASVYLGLAQTYAAQGDRKAARRNVLRALDIAPLYREAQDLLLQLRDM
ncbi:MAG: hypothetical protein H6978_02765 [Gammaproteobacteria bacterium]|nr:hypothetical protein [Gammaproteobacteria bacterium]